MQIINEGSVVVAVALLGLIGAIGITAIIRYEVEAALKVLGSISGLLGVVTGAFVTYFFTQPTLELAQEKATIATEQIAVLEKRAENAEQRLTSLQKESENQSTMFAKFPWVVPSLTPESDVLLQANKPNIEQNNNPDKKLHDG